MKHKQRVSHLHQVALPLALLVLFLPILAVLVYAQSGGSYDLTWNTLGSGGGRNTGGSYTLNSTIGQSLAGTRAGGAYTLVSGFWVSEQITYSVTIGPYLGGLLIYTDTRGLTTTVECPPGAVTEITELRYTPIAAPSQPATPGLRYADQTFDLDAYRNNQPVPNLTFEKAITITHHYSAANVQGIFEDTLKLYRWVSPGWEFIGTRPGEGQTLDTAHRVLTAWLWSLTRYGELGVAQYGLYLPIVVRNQ